jgi:ssDNA-binding Zn-finger/Zn-ribbon topoisomerase 1
MTVSPQCPKCGAEMQLRTAKKGRNTGGKFYGCSNFPKCRGTMAADDGIDLSSDNHKNANDNENRFVMPHNMAARSKYQTYQSCFIESVATSYDVLSAINESRLNEDEIKAYTQWRIDFPINDRIPSFNERSKQVLSVCEKILTRGRVTLCSPYIESELKSFFWYRGQSNKRYIKLHNK